MYGEIKQREHLADQLKVYQDLEYLVSSTAINLPAAGC